MRNRQGSDLELFSTELSKSLEVHGLGLPAFITDIPIGGCIGRALEKGNASVPAPRDEGQSKGFLIHSFSYTPSMSPNRLKFQSEIITIASDSQSSISKGLVAFRNLNSLH